MWNKRNRIVLKNVDLIKIFSTGLYYEINRKPKIKNLNNSA